MNPDALLVGCGDLGTAVGLQLAGSGHRVVGVRRHAEQIPAPLLGVSADLTREAPQLPDLDLGVLVVALSARPRTEEAYRATYVDGMARALDALDRVGARPDRAVLVSSTGVIGDPPGDGLADETTEPNPADGPARVLLEAEEVFADRVPRGTVLRLSGLYGRGEPRLLRQLRDGADIDPHLWTNRIHRDDAVGAIVHLLTMDEDPGPLYIGTDDEPAQVGAVAAHLADLADLPRPPAADPAAGHGKRLSNDLLRSTGWVPARPTYREGLRAEPSERDSSR